MPDPTDADRPIFAILRAAGWDGVRPPTNPNPPVEDLVAADHLVEAMVPMADGRASVFYPWWHGWALTNAFLAGLEVGRTQCDRAISRPPQPPAAPCRHCGAVFAAAPACLCRRSRIDAAAGKDQLLAVVAAADALNQSVAEFPNDPAAWGENLDALHDALAKCPGTSTHAIAEEERRRWQEEQAKLTPQENRP